MIQGMKLKDSAIFDWRCVGNNHATNNNGLGSDAEMIDMRFLPSICNQKGN